MKCFAALAGCRTILVSIIVRNMVLPPIKEFLIIHRHHTNSPYWLDTRGIQLVPNATAHFSRSRLVFMLLCNVKKNNSNERSCFLTKSWRLSMNHRFIFGDRKNTLNPVLGITQSSMSERGNLNASSL